MCPMKNYAVFIKDHNLAIVDDRDHESWTILVNELIGYYPGLHGSAWRIQLQTSSVQR